MKSWKPTKKFWAALGGVIVALATEYFVNPLDGQQLVWNDGEWKVLGAGIAALVAAYFMPNDSTPSGDGVPPK